ncbi:MAG: PD-(D/E)XK nuclease family protein [Bradyrhizobium sp.]|uniref:hypothetical protein n=1 Tax=Bradyrhizobium sp. TaxID=376 RepID=UPI001C29D9FE|nr:hypothetical protein [Bradyrhizobium sp.]MBU6463589.1 recombinase family protein [Pseudomonadota bacterium]MDE2067025.1 PD-(D/E)XK nuclease family protein [Bradyrhizobium sp.]MDE2241245.1 PD-(D/E)XK nuclease family protein [Bradyrhizobium sp.]MDE2470758.1 PD-(D/E)XK nuclease family protein [Bradyrhizobium sp.]
MDDILTLTHATERDVDLLLVEELRCSADFVRWIVNRIAGMIGTSINFTTSDVTHSKRRTYNRREIDICLRLKAPGGLTTILLIENKLDTSEQFEQAESYRAEAKHFVQNGEARAAYTVIVCPAAYARRNAVFVSKFDTNISYEDISAYLAGRSQEPGELGARLKHRHEMLDQAITKSRRGYEAAPLPIIEQFNAKYIALASKKCPALKAGPSMLKEGRPGESKTMIFAPEVLPRWDFLPQMRIVHQLREGNANVNFYGWGDHFTALAGMMASDLAGTPYRLVPTVQRRNRKRAKNKALKPISEIVTVEVPPLIEQATFDAVQAHLRARNP